MRLITLEEQSMNPKELYDDIAEIGKWRVSWSTVYNEKGSQMRQGKHLYKNRSEPQYQRSATR